MPEGFKTIVHKITYFFLSKCALVQVCSYIMVVTHTACNQRHCPVIKGKHTGYSKNAEKHSFSSALHGAVYTIPVTQ
jgi:hypothetical protein